MKSWKKVLILLLTTTFFLLLLIGSTVLLVLGKIERVSEEESNRLEPSEEFFEQNEEENDYEFLDPEKVLLETAQEIIGEENGIINLLLIGQDNQSETERKRSDTMILCSINAKKKEITLISFMRDMYVQIPGYSNNRINAAYAFGGMSLLDEVLEVNFGIQVSGNIAVDFESFQQIVDIVGGVEISLSQEEVQYLKGMGIYTVNEGFNILDGKAALEYVRMRKVAGGDFGRTERQRKLLHAIIQSLKSAEISEIVCLVNEVLPLIKTDLSNGQILSYAVAALPVFSEGVVNSYRIPADGTYQNANIHGMAVLVPDLHKNRALLATYIVG